MVSSKEKNYYSIGEVANMFRLEASTLRFWQKEFEEISPEKDLRGNRIYQEKDINIIESIYSLVKEKGFTLEGAKKILSEERKLKDRKILLINKLKDLKKEIKSLKKIIE